MKQRIQRIWSPEPTKTDTLELYTPSCDKRRISIFPIPSRPAEIKKRHKFQKKFNSFYKETTSDKPTQEETTSMSSGNILQSNCKPNSKEFLQNFNCSKMEFGKPSGLAFVDENSRPFSSSSDVYSVMMSYSKNKELSFNKIGNSMQINKQAKNDIIKLVKDYYSKGTQDINGKFPQTKIANKSLLQHKNIYKAFIFQSLLIPKLKQSDDVLNQLNDEYIQQLMILINDDNFLSDLNSQLKHKETEEQRVQDYDEFSDILSDTGLFRNKPKEKISKSNLLAQPTLRLDRTFSVDQRYQEDSERKPL